ncbi:MAG TPA: restriction endonuclease [Candidatus Angelobacter sp.]|jgi:HJR/Mrr/RecB family endonuclease|nr:restriction endonuclease [Candidatus Angelobacter sp.]
MDFTKVDPRDFELLVGLLFAKQGFQLTKLPMEGVDLGPDFEAVSPDSVHTYVEVKRHLAPLPVSLVKQFAFDMGRFRSQRPGAKGIIVTSGPVSGLAGDLAKQQDIVLIDGDQIRHLLLKHPAVLASFEAARSDKAAFAAAFSSLLSGGSGQRRAVRNRCLPVYANGNDRLS